MLTIFAILAVVLFFGVTVFVHELGHFLLARLCGMKVDTFSIGFGPALWKKEHRGITYKIGALPVGGYVALPQMDPAHAPDPSHPESKNHGSALPPAAAWKRILVSVAGAGGNMLLALLLAWVVFFVGKPSAPHERRCVIGFVRPSSQAWEAGLRTGDTVLAAQNTPVHNWQDLLTILALQSESEAVLEVQRPDEESARVFRLALEKGRMGVRLPDGVAMEELCRVGALMPGGSAEAAGIQPGDLILGLDGIHVFSRPHLIDLVEARAGQDVPIRIRRQGEEITLTVRPTRDPDSDRVLIGILFSEMAVDFDEVSHPRPGTQIREHAAAIFRFLRALVTPKESGAAAGAVGGPVMILYYYWQVVRDSFMMAIWFTVFLNVNLAVLNLLPIPILDGGHILFALFELVFRRPAPPAAIEWAHRIFAALFISLFLFLAFRDTLRLLF